MKNQLNMTKIAKVLRAKRRGKVSSRSGYFGAMQVAAEIEAQVREPTSAQTSAKPTKIV